MSNAEGAEDLRWQEGEKGGGRNERRSEQVRSGRCGLQAGVSGIQPTNEPRAPEKPVLPLFLGATTGSH